MSSIDEHCIVDWCRECGGRLPCWCGGREIPPPQHEDRYDSLFRYYSHQHGLEWCRIKQQAIAESSLNPRAVSPAGAMGLMQIMPATWEEWGEGDPFNPEQSIKAGCRYMQFLIGRFGEIPDETERYKFALAAYNAGRRHINDALALARYHCKQPAEFSKWVEAGRPEGEWQTWAYTSKLLDQFTGQRSRETIHYVRRIMGVLT